MSKHRADLNLSDDAPGFELRPAEGAALREALRAGLVPEDQVRALLLLCQEAARGGQRLDVLALLAERFTAPAQRPALAALLARLGPSVAGGERVPAPESVERARAALARGEIPRTLTRLHDVAIPLPATGLGSRPAPDAGSDSRDGLPARIGSYPVRRELGRGGMGVVYLADDPGLERPVAIKVCTGLSSLDPERRARRDARFRREAQAVARLRHPGIVSVHAFGQHEGVPYIVMDYVPGETLQAVGKRGVSPERAAAWVRDLADALEHAHTAGVLHRDVKPENVVVDLQGRVHLMDFGLAHDALRDTGLTNTGQLLGTAFYMSPEQAAGSEVDARTDVYSLGAVLYFLLARRPPYDGENWLTFLQSLQSKEPAPLRSLNPDVPVALQRVVERCLAKDREQRFPSAAALAAALASPSGASVPAAPRPAGSPPLARIVAGVAAAGVALSLAFAVALRGGAEDAQPDDP
ncbi:MAG: serine/threonine protein kinase, partial [Planctomycetes bacterium]|nr:serine/threonine protein kinase [Planctomycetota bacterium]